MNVRKKAPATPIGRCGICHERPATCRVVGGAAYEYNGRNSCAECFEDVVIPAQREDSGYMSEGDYQSWGRL